MVTCLSLASWQGEGRRVATCRSHPVAPQEDNSCSLWPSNPASSWCISKTEMVWRSSPSQLPLCCWKTIQTQIPLHLSPKIHRCLCLNMYASLRCPQMLSTQGGWACSRSVASSTQGLCLWGSRGTGWLAMVAKLLCSHTFDQNHHLNYETILTSLTFILIWWPMWLYLIALQLLRVTASSWNAK